MCHAGAVESLAAALSDLDWTVRHRAAWALGRIGNAAAAQPLRAALKDENEMVRRAAAEALNELRSKSPAEAK